VERKAFFMCENQSQDPGGYSFSRKHRDESFSPEDDK